MAEGDRLNQLPSGFEKHGELGLGAKKVVVSIGGCQLPDGKLARKDGRHPFRRDFGAERDNKDRHPALFLWLDNIEGEIYRVTLPLPRAWLAVQLVDCGRDFVGQKRTQQNKQRLRCEGENGEVIWVRLLAAVPHLPLKLLSKVRRFGRPEFCTTVIMGTRH